MKTKSLIISLFALFLCLGMTAQSQRKGEWKEKMQQERIAYLTKAVDLTQEEAQNFWPVYNKIEKQREKGRKAVFEAFKKLETAAQKGDADTKVLLNEYLKAKAAADAIDGTAANEFMKVLPAEKVALVFIGEENFRRSQMRKMHHNNRMKEGEDEKHCDKACKRDMKQGNKKQIKADKASKAVE